MRNDNPSFKANCELYDVSGETATYIICNLYKIYYIYIHDTFHAC